MEQEAKPKDSQEVEARLPARLLLVKYTLNGID